MHQNGTLVVSIDLRTEGHTILAAQSLPARLLSLLDSRRIPATWSLAEPASAAFIERLDRSSTDHEVALLCEHQWGGPAVGRTTFARQLSRRLSAAQRAGLHISTLALRSTELRKDLDLIVKHRLTAVRGRMLSTRTAERSNRPQAVRFGVLHVPVTRILPGRSGWSLWGSGHLWRKSIERSCRAEGYFQLGIDATTLEESHLKEIESALESAARLRDDRRLTIQTLRQMSQQFDRKREHLPSRSVLRAA